MVKKRKQVIDDDFILNEEDSVFDEKSDESEQRVKEQLAKDKLAISIKDDVVLDENLQKKKLDEAEQAVSKQGSKKKKLWNWVFFAVNVVVVAGILIFQLTGDEGVASPIGLTIYFGPVLLLLAVFALNIFSDTMTISYLLKRNTGKWRLGLSYKVNANGRYYDAVTPLATGGQPFQITYLKSHDVPLHTAMSIPLAKYIFSQICWVALSFVCMIVSFTGDKYNSYVSIASVIGFILGSFMLFLIVFLSISKTWGRKLVVGILKFLQKIKILKNYEKYYDKIMKTIEDYQSIMRQYIKSPKDMIVMIFIYMTRMFAMYSMPFLVFCVFKGFDTSLYIEFFVKAVLIDLAASFIPLPGGTGMSELTFTAMFSFYFNGGTLFYALLTWRFFSYYYYLLQGVSIITYDMFYGNRKYKWLKRKDILMEESTLFKQQQIDRFRAERKKIRQSEKRNQKKKIKV